MPVDVQTLVIYRNSALYAEAGLDPAAPFADLEELFSHALDLTVQTDEKTSQIGCNTGYLSAWLTILFQQYLQREEDEAAWIDPVSNQFVWQDYPAIFETFNWFCTLSAQADDDDFLSFLSSEEQFVLDKSAMQIGHPVHRGVFENFVPDVDYTIVPFPRVRPSRNPTRPVPTGSGSSAKRPTPMLKRPGNGSPLVRMKRRRQSGTRWLATSPA